MAGAILRWWLRFLIIFRYFFLLFLIIKIPYYFQILLLILLIFSYFFQDSGHFCHIRTQIIAGYEEGKGGRQMGSIYFVIVTLYLSLEFDSCLSLEQLKCNHPQLSPSQMLYTFLLKECLSLKPKFQPLFVPRLEILLTYPTV